jgi:heme exporter protein A
MSSALAELRHVTKRLADRPVLRDVSLDLQAGEVAAILGPNGAGKSTLLKVLAGIWKPSSGEVLRFGAPPGEDPADRRVGYLGHQSLLYRMLSGRENLEFYARLYGLADPKRQAEAALRRVGMYRFQHDPVGRYSRGMEQRTAIARAFLHDPRLLLLDEPYTGLDVEARVILDRLIAEVVGSGGAAILITHHLEEAERIATRVGILWQGRLTGWHTGAEAIASARVDYEARFRVAGVSHGS